MTPIASLVHRSLPLAAAACVALAVTGCAGGPATAAPTAPAPSAGAPPGDVIRYCALLAEVNGVGERVFADLPENATAEEQRRAKALFVEQAGPQMAEMIRVAPPEIRTDLELYQADVRARAAGEPGPDPAAVTAAEERARGFDEQHCPGGPDGT